MIRTQPTNEYKSKKKLISSLSHEKFKQPEMQPPIAAQHENLRLMLP